MELYEVIETCRIYGLDIQLMVHQLSKMIDRFKALELISKTFKKQLGFTSTNDLIVEIMSDNKPPMKLPLRKKPPLRKFVNTTDEKILFPYLIERCFEIADDELKTEMEKKRAKGHLQAFLEKWKNEPQQVQATLVPQQGLKDILPEHLKTDEAVKIFQRAIDTKMIEKTATGLKWNDTKQLLAYFATRISDKFNLTTRLDKDGNKTTDWKTFETLFKVQGLKDAKQNWMRLYTRFEPTGFEKVDALF